MDDEKKTTKKVTTKKTTSKTPKKASTKKDNIQTKKTSAKITEKKTATEKKVNLKVKENKEQVDTKVDTINKIKEDADSKIKADTEKNNSPSKVKKVTISLKNKKEIAKALSKPKTQSAKTKAKQVASKKASKKDPLKNVNVITKKEEPKTEEPKKKVVKEKKSSKKKEEKTKLVLPKEWTAIKKNKKTEKKEKEFTNTNTLTNMFKKSIFEEVDEKAYQEQKKVKKVKRKKHILIFLIVVIILVGVGLALLKYNDFVKEQLAVYDVYKIGDKITLKDESVWYVIADSDAHSDSIKILKESHIDINGDGQINDKDKMQYNKNDVAEYDDQVEGNSAYYLSHDYMTYLEKNVGHVEEVGLLDSKEFVKVRQRLGYGDEWSEGNWLANSKLGNWWIESEQNQKVFAVSPNGSFKLFYAKSYNYVRPTIVIKKELVIAEKEEPIEENIDNSEKKD